jgi:hypothetical protein
MTAPLVQRLSLVVDAATGQTETRMDALATSSREAGEAAGRAAGQVAAAAERVAAAQLRRDDAAGKVRVAEQQLLDLQEKGNASAGRLTAAQERLESARRGLAVATRQVETAEQEQVVTQGRATEATARAATETERARAGAGRFGDQLGNLKAAAAGLVGFQVGDWLRDQATAYLNGARGAQTLATSMNATVEEGGRLSQLFSTLGLDAADLLEIQAEFAQKVGENGRNLETFGASLQMNAGGTVNWANTLVDALTQLQKIPDATERNRLGFQLFGEEGYKQLSRLLSSGLSVQEALERLGTPFTEEDVRATQQFDRAIMDLQLSGGELGRNLAREVIPAVTGLVGGASDLVGILTAVPLPILLATTAAILLATTGFSPAAAAGARLSAVAAVVRTEVGLASGAMITGGAAGGILGAGMMAGAAGASRLATLAGGPLGIALIAAGTALHFASQGSDDLESHAKDAAQELLNMKGSADAVAIATRTTANDLEENAGYWERSAAYVKGHAEGLTGWEATANDLVSPFQRLTMGFGDTADTARGFELAIEEAREALGEYGAQQEMAQENTRKLNDLIAAGTTTGSEFAEAVAIANQTQLDQTRTSDTAAAAIAAYRAQTDQAVQAVRGLIDAELSQQDASFAFLDAMDTLNGATDDAKTSVDEVAKAHVELQEAALRAGDAAADAAVAQAKAAGTIVTPLDEAKIRADALITDLQARLNTPGLSDAAKTDLQGLIDRLTEAREKGDVQALVTLTGVDEATGDLDEATGDREALVNVESRGGPAVKDYLDRITEERLALIRTESRGGPAVVSYLDRITGDRLSLIRLETRGGPAVEDYISGLARERLAIIRVETRGGPDVDRYLDDLAGQRRTAVIDVQRTGSGARPGGSGPGLAGLTGAGGSYGDTIIQQLVVQPQVDSGGRLTAQSAVEAGRSYVAAIRAYERKNGPGWRGNQP